MTTAQEIIISAQSMAADIISSVIDLGNVDLGSIQSVFSGAPAGSLYLEISNDIIPVGSDPNSNVTHWDTYGNAQTIAAAGSYTFNISNMGYKWLRLHFAHTGGSSGSLTSTLAAKDA